MKQALDHEVAQYFTKPVDIEELVSTITKNLVAKKYPQFAGEKVTVTGNLDVASKTIHVAYIKAAS